ncbi:type II toxin-antitoxin system [compost metagenome]
MGTPLVLKSGTEVITHPVSDLQKKYRQLLDKVISGCDVVLTRHGEPLVAIVDIEQFRKTQQRAARYDELAQKVELLQARLDLAAAAEPSLAKARQQANEIFGKTLAEAKETLKRRRSNRLS